MGWVELRWFSDKFFVWFTRKLKFVVNAGRPPGPLAVGAASMRPPLISGGNLFNPCSQNFGGLLQ